MVLTLFVSDTRSAFSMPVWHVGCVPAAAGSCGCSTVSGGHADCQWAIFTRCRCTCQRFLISGGGVVFDLMCSCSHVQTGHALTMSTVAHLCLCFPASQIGHWPLKSSVSSCSRPIKPLRPPHRSQTRHCLLFIQRCVERCLLETHRVDVQLMQVFVDLYTCYLVCDASIRSCKFILKVPYGDKRKRGERQIVGANGFSSVSRAHTCQCVLRHRRI
jgi:hypothetical protein